MEEDMNKEKPNINEEDLQTKLLTNNNNNNVQKGGLKTMPFIIANEAFERVASGGSMANMILYLMEAYHMEAVTGTSVMYMISAFSCSLSIVGAFVSDSYLGRFRAIAIGSFSSFLGMTLLWLTSMIPQLTPSEHETGSKPTPAQLGFLLASLGLISTDSACIKPCSMAFGADQFKHHNNPRLMDSYFNWYYATLAVSAVITSTVVVYIQDHFGWRVGFAVPVLVMLFSTLVFLLGSSLYVKVKVDKITFSGFVQVLIVAFKNRKIRLLPSDSYNHSEEMDRVELTDNLRFLNKACVVRDASPSSIPTVEKVESLKSIIRIIPIWSSGILPSTCFVTTFPILQAKQMNRNITSWLEIPAASYVMFSILTVLIWITFYDRILVPLLAKFTNEPRGLHPKTRIGIGFILPVIAMVVAAIMETIRRDLANKNLPVNMSAMWLAPQFMLLGLTDAFNTIGQMEFYYSELPKSMASLVMAVFLLSAAISAFVGYLLNNIVNSVTSQGGGIRWLSSDINEGHLNYYYWLLSFVNLLNFFYYLFCCRIHHSSGSRVLHEVGEGRDSIEDIIHC
ncbi:protein NRT1/ PTR FAMILY 1.2-like [Bidens hawaiensis]|uniref:protein NRT1/ PTR FAMILY 1.2-like n=1 Tax=Bidens hawaiensis TaxID=980011 RepID=UPI00404B26BA